MHDLNGTITLSIIDFSAHWNCQVKPLDHSHDLPPPGKKGRTYICSCLIYLRPTVGAKLLMKKWIEELQDQPWSRAKKANDQPGFNWALNKTAGQVDMQFSVAATTSHIVLDACIFRCM